MYYNQGDIIFVDLNPTKGHEQSGRRPVVVVTIDEFQKNTGLHGVCPITNTVTDYPTHVPFDKRTDITGNILCEQFRTLDLSQRNPNKKEECPLDILDEVLDIVQSFF